MKKSIHFSLLILFCALALVIGCSSGSSGSSDSDGGGSANTTAKWYVAKGAPSDSQGADGDLYLDTDATIVYVKAGGHWVAAASLKGPAGNGWLVGAGAPAASLGMNGDFYLDTSTTMTYRKFNGVWEGMFPMQGSTWFSGTVDPTPSVPAAAKAGDFYLNTQTTVIWKKDGSGSWSSLVILQAAGSPQFVCTPEMYNTDGQYFNALTYGNGKFVAVGVYGTIAVSTDGVSWTMTNHFPDYSLLPGRSSVPGKGLVEDYENDDVKSNLHDIAYGNGVFVAVGDAYDYDDEGPNAPVSVYTSPDGTTWTQYTGDWTSYDWKNVVFANGLFLAAVDNGDYFNIYTSPNGTVWTEHSLPSTCSNLSNIVYGNGKFLAAGQSGGWQIFTSSDGASWTLETGITFEDDVMAVDRIAFGNGAFVAVGTRGTEDPGFWCSFNGKNWYSVEFPFETGVSYQNVTYGNSFVVLGYVDYNIKRVFTSSNGVSWAFQDWNSRFYFTDAAWGPLNGGTFAIALGEYYNP